MVNYTLKILAIEKETADAVTIHFKQPVFKKIKYQPGQYLTLVFRIDGRRYLRPYSFSSAPGLDDTLNITVKRMPGGIVSNHILDQLKPGDLIEVLEPMGDFLFPENGAINEHHLVFWGSGSGITPLFSMMKYALWHFDKIDITLIYGNRNKETTIFHEQIATLKREYSDRFRIFSFYSQATFETADPCIIPGRITTDKILGNLKDQFHPSQALHYICGPSGLKESVRSTLRLAGVNEAYIFCEDFEIVRNPMDFKDIVTQRVSIIKNNLPTSFDVSKGKSILEAGLDAMMELEYSCQTGNCMLCKGTLVNGQVKMLGNCTAKLLDGECLLCCSFPLTNDVQIVLK